MPHVLSRMITILTLAHLASYLHSVWVSPRTPTPFGTSILVLQNLKLSLQGWVGSRAGGVNNSNNRVPASGAVRGFWGGGSEDYGGSGGGLGRDTL